MWAKIVKGASLITNSSSPIAETNELIHDLG